MPESASFLEASHFPALCVAQVPLTVFRSTSEKKFALDASEDTSVQDVPSRSPRRIRIASGQKLKEKSKGDDHIWSTCLGPLPLDLIKLRIHPVLPTVPLPFLSPPSYSIPRKPDTLFPQPMDFPPDLLSSLLGHSLRIYITLSALYSQATTPHIQFAR